MLTVNDSPGRSCPNHKLYDHGVRCHFRSDAYLRCQPVCKATQPEARSGADGGAERLSSGDTFYEKFLSALVRLCACSALLAGLRTGGRQPLLHQLRNCRALPAEALAAPQAATAVQSPGITTYLPDSLYFPLLSDGSGTATPEAWVETTLAGMSIAEKIGQMLIIGIDGEVVTPEICTQIEQLKPGGITLSNANLSDPEALRLLTTGLQECARAAGLPGLLITLAHEGEYVDRFQSGTTLFPAALALGATGDPERGIPGCPGFGAGAGVQRGEPDPGTGGRCTDQL